MFNDFYARRTSQLLMFQNIYRCHGPLYRATNITRETLNGRFVREEFMRINGQRAMPQLVGASSLTAPELNNFAWCHLLATQAPSLSYRAATVQQQTPLTRSLAKLGLLQANVPTVRAESVMQVMLLDNLARTEGVIVHVPLMERQDLMEDNEDNEEMDAVGEVPAAAAAAAGGSGDA